MPELPEVETIARDLASILTGQEVKRAKLITAAIREDCGYKNLSSLKGKCLNSISRRGKNLIFHFSGNTAMICHLKMTGQLLIRKNTRPDKKHLHFYIEFTKDKLEYYDVRKFGRVCVIKENNLEKHPRLQKLGPEPFALTPDLFAKLIKKRNKAIKTALLDQEICAGLGNIYADESLFDASIRPTLKAGKISTARLKQLHRSIIKVLEYAINNRGTSVDDYLDGFGQSGNFQNLLKVYGKTGQACPNCGKPIKRIVLGGRSTHYCSICQR
jgi:formamidopyrimidine-DNA glycosylase